MQEQNARDEVVSQIERLSDSQMESVRRYISELTEEANSQADLLSQYLTFWCQGQLFGIGINKIIQIISMTKITALPDFPQYIKGVISLRDEMIPVMDLRLRLGKEEADYTSHTCIIIVSVQDRSFGIIVDGVNDVATISNNEICPPPQHPNRDSNYLSGIAKPEKVVLILNLEHLLSEEELGIIFDLPGNLDM